MNYPSDLPKLVRQKREFTVEVQFEEREDLFASMHSGVFYGVLYDKIREINPKCEFQLIVLDKD